MGDGNSIKKIVMIHHRSRGAKLPPFRTSIGHRSRGVTWMMIAVIAVAVIAGRHMARVIADTTIATMIAAMIAAMVADMTTLISVSMAVHAIANATVMADAMMTHMS